MVVSRPLRLTTELRLAPTRYLPLERLAAGGMAEVWRAQAVMESGQTYPVAIKRMLPRLAADQLYRSMFEDEARLGMLLRHRNVVRVYDARDVAGTYLMIMELVDGCSVKEVMGVSHARGVGMAVPTALHVVRELARGLDYAHTAADGSGQHMGIVHRDVSPHNVLLDRRGRVKLTDFGLANANVHQTMGAADRVGGKLGYLAPEVIAQRPADHRVDLFAVGILLWEILTGRRLFQGRDDAQTVQNVMRMPIPAPSNHNPDVSPDLDALTSQLLARRTDERLPSARRLIAALDPMIGMTDPAVSERAVSLLLGADEEREVGRADRGGPGTTPDGLDALRVELDAFVRAAEGSEYDLGARALDPTDFDGAEG